tara:strand:+ start:1046 stop:1327 length:282 start_codon:yes stop_codon:yes gene_type:complete
MTKKRVLHLPLKTVYFHQIKSGSKIFEYRLQTEYWKKRLVGREYDEIHIKLGYPKKGDQERILIRTWEGILNQTIQHEHFGSEEVNVFAIKVN